jgi:hypothetical protein
MLMVRVTLDGADRVRNVYEWKINSLKLETWAEMLKEETERL